MMTNQKTFSNDNGNQGTTDNNFNSGTDNSSDGGADSGSKLQQQIDIMQKRIGDKDDFIKTLEGENQDLREKMSDIEAKIESMGSVEDALKRMEAAKDSNQDTNLDEDALVSKVLGKMSAKTAKEKADANFKEVSDKLTKLYGADKVNEVVNTAAKENGLSYEDIVSLAERSPTAVYKMLGTDHKPATPSPSSNSHFEYTDEIQTKEQKLAYFSKLRKEKPEEYYKPETQKAFRLACLSDN